MKYRKRIVVIIVLVIVVLTIYEFYQISRHVANVNESAAKIRQLRQAVSANPTDQ